MANPRKVPVVSAVAQAGGKTSAVIARDFDIGIASADIIDILRMIHGQHDSVAALAHVAGNLKIFRPGLPLPEFAAARAEKASVNALRHGLRRHTQTFKTQIVTGTSSRRTDAEP